jgi:hypothetical protein
MTTTTIRVSGPVFDRTADHDAEAFCHDLADQVSRQAYAEVMTNLDTSIRHPTPYYETQINIRNEAPGTKVVNDAGVVYGPWLEGVGSRNFPVTRFKGYAAFRRAVQATEAEVPRLAEHTIRPYVERMNGVT